MNWWDVPYVCIGGILECHVFFIHTMPFGTMKCMMIFKMISSRSGGDGIGNKIRRKNLRFVCQLCLMDLLFIYIITIIKLDLSLSFCCCAWSCLVHQYWRKLFTGAAFLIWVPAKPRTEARSIVGRLKKQHGEQRLKVLQRVCVAVGDALRNLLLSRQTYPWSSRRGCERYEVRLMHVFWWSIGSYVRVRPDLGRSHAETPQLELNRDRQGVWCGSLSVRSRVHDRFQFAPPGITSRRINVIVLHCYGASCPSVSRTPPP
jgi:hypothetical protein